MLLRGSPPDADVRVSVFGFEGVEFGPYLVGEFVNAGEFVQPGPDLRQSDFDALFVSHTAGV